MIGLKRLIRPAVFVSIVGHAGALATGLIFVSANPSQSVPPDAMVVDIVQPDEAPRFEGTPSDLRTSGSQLPPGNTIAPVQPPPLKPAAQAQQQEQKRSNRKDDDRKAATPPVPEGAFAEMFQSETAQIQPAPPKPASEAAPDQPDVVETLAKLAMVGGPLGGGFAAPAVNTDRAGYDFTVEFRERVSACSDPPAGIDAGDKIHVALRVSLNRDGTLASPPRLLEPIASPKEQAVMQSAINALQKCQPYTMLPPEKYKQWKTLDLVFFPLNFFSR
jgi:hypothetical protein